MIEPIDHVDDSRLGVDGHTLRVASRPERDAHPAAAAVDQMQPHENTKTGLDFFVLSWLPFRVVNQEHKLHEEFLDLCGRCALWGSKSRSARSAWRSAPEARASAE